MMRAFEFSLVVAALGVSTPALAQMYRSAPPADHAPTHRPPPSDHAYPAQPPLGVENVRPRRGHVWVPGHYEWRNGGYVWVAGRWEREQKGRRWSSGRWEMQGDRYVWIAAVWQDRPAYPTEPPPPARIERVTHRRGHVWVAGHYQWNNFRWVWAPGHWERARHGHRWEPGCWERSGDRYAWHPGTWHRD